MEITTRQEQNTASIRTRTPVEGLPGEMGNALGEIMQLLGAQRSAPAGAPFAMYYNMDMKDLDVEIGCPVAAPFTAGGRVKPGTLPGGRTAACVHTGPYTTIAESYTALSAFMEKNKVVPQGPCYEIYINDPQTTEPKDLLTEICFPLKG